MLSLTKKTLGTLYRQSENFSIIVLRKPLPPSLISMTLDIDDVVLAKQTLDRNSSWYDPNVVKEYEITFAKWNGSKHAFAFMSGRVSLSACIYALDLKPNDEVILPGYTCVVVPNAFHFAGLKTIYSDIETDTYGLDVSLIENKITSKTKAIFLQHLFGLVCRDYEKIVKLARKHRLYIIEDCAQSAGAVFKDKKIGNMGDVAIYSSERSKVFNTIQGGFATTNNFEIAQKINDFYQRAPFPDTEWIYKQLHNINIDYYLHKDANKWWKGELLSLMHFNKFLISTTKKEEKGFMPLNYGCKMPAAIATIGLNQLKKVDLYNLKRRNNSKLWDEWCDKNGYKKPLVVKESTPVFLRYPIMVEASKKKKNYWAYKELRIKTGVWFISNTHPSPSKLKDCPNADKAVRQCINFPTLLDNYDK